MPGYAYVEIIIRAYIPIYDFADTCSVVLIIRAVLRHQAVSPRRSAALM